MSLLYQVNILLLNPWITFNNLAVFFVCFRECLETSIVVSILLSLLKSTLHEKGGTVGDATHKRLVRQVSW
jgi:high-affinity Fe2+/Pb2+ permease